jgi:hypothetical protein
MMVVVVVVVIIPPIPIPGCYHDPGLAPIIAVVMMVVMVVMVVFDKELCCLNLWGARVFVYRTQFLYGIWNRF